MIPARTAELDHALSTTLARIPDGAAEPSVDTQIATSDTKYAYLRWRPVTAIRATEDPDRTERASAPMDPLDEPGRVTARTWEDYTPGEAG